MRKFFIISAFVAVGAVVSGSAIANFVYPGRVIIGYGGGGGGTGGTTTSAAALGPEPCVLEKEIECECWEGLDLITACLKDDVTLGCLGPDTQYAELIQKENVLSQGEEHTLGSLKCSGESKETAYVRLPLPK